MFEYASAAFQLAIVLAGAAALTTVMWLTFISVGLGVVGSASRSWPSWRRPWSTSRANKNARQRGLPGVVRTLESAL